MFRNIAASPPVSAGMLTIAEAQRRTENFLTGQMLEALRAVEYELPSFDTEPREMSLSVAARARVAIGMSVARRMRPISSKRPATGC
jgi:hypothetical protein